MNSEEGLSLAKMAVAVLLVVLVIGAVVAVVYAAYSWFNSGTSKLGDQVTSIDKSAYSRYDDTQISGTDVLSALKEYRESEIGIFIVNMSNQNNTFNNAPADADTVKATNYCARALVYGDTSGEVTQLTEDSGRPTCVVTYTANNRWEVGSITFDGATAKVNTNFSPTTQTNSPATYVKQSAKWYANLVYSESTSDVCGILFRQMN